MRLFWTNTIYYIFLAVLTIFELIFIILKSKNKKSTFALFCTIAGMTFTVEAIVFCVLQGYNYMPMIFLKSGFDDGLAGNLFSQFSIAATAVLLSVLNSKYYWNYIAAGVYGFIETIFLYLGIYKHFWYRTWITFIGLSFLFFVFRKMYNVMINNFKPLTRYIYILFALYTLHMPLVIWVFKIYGIQTFNQYLILDEIGSYSVLAVINLFFLSNIILIIHLFKIKKFWKAAVIFSLYILYFIADRINLVIVKEGWFIVFTTVDIFGMYLFVYILDMLYHRPNKQKIEKVKEV